jgi:hypothetical protein
MPTQHKRKNITPSSVSRQLRAHAGHEPYVHNANHGGFEIREKSKDPAVLTITYRGVERDHLAREDRIKAFREEMRRLRMSLTDILGLEVCWGMDSTGEVDTSHLLISMDPIERPGGHEKVPTVAEVTQVSTEVGKAPVAPPEGILTTFVEDVFRGKEPYDEERPEGGSFRDLFIGPMEILGTNKAIAFAHAISTDDGKAESLERALHHKVLLAIAAGAEDPAHLAMLALETQHLPLAR